MCRVETRVLGAELQRDTLRKRNLSDVLRSTSFLFFSFFLSVYLKRIEGFPYQALRRTPRSRLGPFDYFFFTSNIPNESIVRVPLGGSGEGIVTAGKFFFLQWDRINVKIITISKQTVVVVALVAGKKRRGHRVKAAAATWGRRSAFVVG